MVIKKALRFRAFFITRGPERIRTAVEAFAELCLATRPQDLFGMAKIGESVELQNIIPLFFK